MTDPYKTRGYVNKNPGNIRLSHDDWQGLATTQTDPAFFQFVSMDYGVRAMARILRNYQNKSKINTIRKIIRRWAPGEDNNDEGAYAKAVSKSSGFGVDEVLNLNTYMHLKPVIVGMIKVECAGLVLPDETIDHGLALAGVPKGNV